MSKARKPKTPGTAKPPKAKPPELPVVVSYDLFTLPTAFHKAGLAGLILLIESLKARQVLTAEEAKYELTATGVTVTFTESLLRKLMDDLYDAQQVEVVVKKKWPSKEPKREETLEEEVDGKTTRTRQFIYDQVQPAGRFFDNVFEGEKEIWRKLWRDFVWNILRGRPTARESYNQRAIGQSCKEGPNAWTELIKVLKARAKNTFHTTGLSSSLLPGAQASNAEGVTFEGRAEHNILLHFWLLTVILFVPQAVEADGKTDFVGYTIAIPEVQNLPTFLEEYPQWMDSKSALRRGYRPAEAVIDLPAEGALAFLDNLALLTGLQVETGELRFSISSVDYIHLDKKGDNVKTVTAGRVSPNRRLLSGYRAIISPKDESTCYRNPLFRRGLLIALLDEEPWYRPFAPMFSTFDAGVFIRQLHQSEKGPPPFATDAAKKLRHETKLFTQTFERNATMPDIPRPAAPPAVIVNRVVRSYLLALSEEKTGIDPNKYKTPDGETDYKAIPDEFNVFKQKLALSLTLEFRSRREQAFVDYFAVKFFSVTQRLSEADRLELASLLTVANRRDDLKTLVLLSLSANS